MYYKPQLGDILELCMEDLKNIELAFKYVFNKPCGSYKSFITAEEYRQFIERIIDYTKVDKTTEGLNWGYILETHINIEDEKEGVMLRIKYNRCKFRDIYINESDVRDIIGLGACFDECLFDHVIFDRSCLTFAKFSNTFFSDVSFLYTSLKNCVFDVCKFEECLFHHCNILNCPGLSCIPLACPSHGGFIGWKKAIAELTEGHVLIKLYIPADAKRSSATSKKCRCSKAKVLDITSLDGKKHFYKADSLFDRNFKYKVGEYVEPWGIFDDDRWNECSSGIHFFINKRDAIDY